MSSREPANVRARQKKKSRDNKPKKTISVIYCRSRLSLNFALFRCVSMLGYGIRSTILARTVFFLLASCEDNEKSGNWLKMTRFFVRHTKFPPSSFVSTRLYHTTIRFLVNLIEQKNMIGTVDNARRQSSSMHREYSDWNIEKRIWCNR